MELCKLNYAFWNSLFLCIILLSACKTTDNAVTTGWNYNESPKSEFEKPSSKSVKLPHTAKKYFRDMLLIKGGSFSMGRVSGSQTAEKDSTLLVTGIPKRVTVSSFYLCNHEVTNAEYREFVSWVRDSIALSLIAEEDPSFYINEDLKLLNWSRRSEIYSETYATAIRQMYLPQSERFYRRKEFDNTKLIYTCFSGNYNDSVYVYPDTLCWITDFTFAYNEPLVKLYFWHPAYNEYPVAGVSWKQANAYCHWRTERLNKSLAQSSKNGSLYPNFRLPTEAEWEYSALGQTEQKSKDENHIYELQLYPWKGDKLNDKRGNYYANFGPVIDQNGLWIKQFSENKKSEENYYYTSPIKSFPPNGFKLFDMAGNLAEWVQDVPVILRNEGNPNYFSQNQFYTDSVKKTNERKDSLEIYYKKKIISNKSLNRDTLTDTQITIYDDFETALKKIIIRASEQEPSLTESDIEINKSRYIAQAKDEMHDAKVLDNNRYPRMVKGGAWTDAPLYLQCGTRTVFPENKSSARIGFRVAMTYIPDSNDKK